MDFVYEFFGDGYSKPFSLDTKRNLFRLAEKEISPEDFDVWNLDMMGTTVPVDELFSSSAVVALGSGHLIQMPRMTRWLWGLEGNNRSAAFSEASEIMRTVARQLDCKFTRHDSIGIHTSHSIIQTEAIVSSGELVVSPAATFFNSTSDWASGFAGFEFHNADTVQQETILCAGVGALASICIRETDNYIH